jgi:hypothetical protein
MNPNFRTLKTLQASAAQDLVASKSGPISLVLQKDDIFF